MVSENQSIVGFLGLDEISLKLAASLLRSGYTVRAFEVCIKKLLLFADFYKVLLRMVGSLSDYWIKNGFGILMCYLFFLWIGPFNG